MAEPVNIDTKFSAADQTLAFTLCWFATDRTMSEKDHRLYAGILGDVLPFVTEDHPIVAPMVEISKQIVSTIENGGPVARGFPTATEWRGMNAMKTFKEQVADMETLASCGRFIIETVENALEVLAQNDIEARVHIGADGTTADQVIVLPEGLQLPAPKSMRDVFRHAMEAAQPKPETTPEPSEPAPTPKPTKSAATTPKAELVTGPWSEDEIQEFISLTLDGYLPKDIAARLNRRLPETIRCAAPLWPRKTGLPPPRHPQLLPRRPSRPQQRPRPRHGQPARPPLIRTPTWANCLWTNARSTPI